MKPETKVFIVAQLLDIATTLVGTAILGHGEIGIIAFAFLPLGWPFAVLVKVFTIAAVAVILERLKPKSAWVWVIPGISVTAVSWNIIRMIVLILK